MSKFTSPPDQRYACRDCPARCCRVPWSIRFSDEEVVRYLSEPWIAERVGDEGMAVLGRGVLPMREHERRLQCVFLDDDLLCGMHKKFGHEYIPGSCQAFPFGFMRDEKAKKLIAQLSHLCPSIRDNYGEPVAGQLKDKLEQKGEAERMTTAVSTMNGVVVPRKHFLRVSASWRELLARDESPAEALALIYDRQKVFEKTISDGHERTTDKLVDKALAAAREEERQDLVCLRKPSFEARALYSYLLGNLCYPSRVRQGHRVGKPSFFAFHGLRNLSTKLAWLRTRGTVDMLFAPKPFRLQDANAVKPFMKAPEAGVIRDYLQLVLDRRQLFSRPRYLMDAVIDMAMATALISRFARCLAAANDREDVIVADVKEGISVTELVLLSHVALSEEGKTVSNLRTQMLTNRFKLRDMLASEA